MVRLRKVLRSSFLILIITVIIFVFIEGTCSIWHALALPHERKVYTKYDEQIGWVNISNMFVKNFYGNGIYLKINSQGFRNNKDFTVAVPKDKLRIICSGDSFTFGFGVSNDQAWCQQLASLDPRLETVNMGVGAYGIDQSYLLYLRNGVKLDHQIHLFSFITLDILDRYGDSFMRNGKPYFKLENNKLGLCNVPVPKRAFYVPWFATYMQGVNDLRSVKMLSSVYAQWRHKSKKDPKINYDKRIVLKILDELDKSNKSRNSVLVAVYLPTKRDFDEDLVRSGQLRSFLKTELKKRGIVFIDLFDDFQKLPIEQFTQMFTGHYSVKGNQYVAGLIYEKLKGLIN